MLLKMWTLGFALALSAVSFAQNLDTAALNRYFSNLEQRNRFMGSVALIKDGKISYQNQTGWIDQAAQIKPNSESIYRVGSISKSFTSVLTFKAIEAGKIELSTPISRFFPDWPKGDQITIDQLLNHHSGIYNFTNDFTTYLTYYTEPKSRQEMLELFAQYDPAFDPGAKAEYSNSNFVLLAYILEDLYQKPYATLIQEHIASPLGLKFTGEGKQATSANNESFSYRYNAKKETWTKEKETDMSISIGAGSIVSTPTELLHFAHALFNNELLTKTSVDQMKALTDNFGRGLFQVPFYNTIGYGHTGGIDGFVSIYGFYPEENCGFAITSNGLNMDDNDIAIVLLKALFNQPIEVSNYEPYTPKKKNLKRYPGTYSSATFPLKITIALTGETLSAQATGQGAFQLEPAAEHVFRFDPAGIEIEFDPAEEQLSIKQAGQTNTLTRE